METLCNLHPKKTPCSCPYHAAKRARSAARSKAINATDLRELAVRTHNDKLYAQGRREGDEAAAAMKAADATLAKLADHICDDCYDERGG